MVCAALFFVVLPTAQNTAAAPLLDEVGSNAVAAVIRPVRVRKLKQKTTFANPSLFEA